MSAILQRLGPLLRWLSAIAFTALLGLALYGLDRATVGPERVGGLLEIAHLQDLPKSVAEWIRPTYFPERLQWPPQRLWLDVPRRSADPPAVLWMGLADRATGAVMLWLGVSVSPQPLAPLEIAGCVDPAGRRSCPKGLTTRSQPGEGGRTVTSVSALDARETALIVDSLRPPTHAP